MAIEKISDSIFKTVETKSVETTFDVQDVKAKIATCDTQIAALQAEKANLEKLLVDAKAVGVITEAVAEEPIE